LQQKFQELRGTGSVDGAPVRVEDPRLRGDEIRFTLVAEMNGRAVRHEFTGRIAGDSMSGKARTPHAESGAAWQAKRIARAEIDIDAASGASAVAHEPLKKGHI